MGEIRLLEERLLKADQGLAQFSEQLEAQSSELRAAQQQAQQASEQPAVERRSGSNHHQSKTWLSSRQAGPVLIALAALTEGGWIPMVPVHWRPWLPAVRWAG